MLHASRLSYLRGGIVFLLGVLIGALFLVLPVQAVTVVEEGGDKVVSEEVLLDEEVTPEDLDEQAPRVLPDSPWYAFKRLGRSFRSLVTRDPAKRAELKLHYADQQLLEAQALADEGKEVVAGEVLDRYKEEMGKIAALKDRLQAAGEEAAPRVDAFVQKMTDRTLKHQRMLDHLEGKLPEQAFEKVTEARDRALEHAGEVFERIVRDPEKLREHFERAAEGQEGSTFKDLKNLEVFQRLRDELPEEVREGVTRAMEQTRERFRAALEEVPEDEREEKLRNYFRHQKGNAVRHLESLDEVVDGEDLPTDLRRHLEGAREGAIERLRAEFEERPEQLRKRLEHFRDAEEPERFEFLERLRNQLPDEARDITTEARDAAFERFHERFGDDEERVEKFKAEFRSRPEFREKFEEKGVEVGARKLRGSEKEIDSERHEEVRERMETRQENVQDRVETRREERQDRRDERKELDTPKKQPTQIERRGEVQERVETRRDNVQERVKTHRENVQERREEVRDRAQDLRENVRDRVQDRRDGGDQKQPTAVE